MIESLFCPKCKYEIVPSNTKKFIGLRNIVTSKKEWKYLCLYEKDIFDDNTIMKLKDIYDRIQTSYIIYKTGNGYHFVGLTPLSVQMWASAFSILQNISPQYYAGNTLRMTRKKDEIQELCAYKFDYPYMERLASFYIKRFNIPASEIPIYGSPSEYFYVLEKYWTSREGIKN